MLQVKSHLEVQVEARVRAGLKEDSDRLRKAAGRKLVLTEEDYVDAMDAIITRDFFPDLPKLRANLDYLEALERQDSRLIAQAEHRMHELPSSRDDDVPSLDQFLARHTSEDNASYADIQARSVDALRAKRWWADSEEREARWRLEHAVDSAQLAPQNPEGALTVRDDTRPARLDTIPVCRTNALFFPPGTIAPSLGAKGASSMGPPPALNASRTRFGQDQLGALADNGGATQPRRALLAPRDALRAAGVRASGVGLVSSTPVLTPGGAGESPMMTWGAIGSTPLLLQALAVPLPGDAEGAPRYHLPDQPRREAVSHQLAEGKRTVGASTPQQRMPSRAGTPLLSSAAAKLAGALRQGSAARNHQLGFSLELRASYRGTTPRTSTHPAQQTPSQSPLHTTREPSLKRARMGGHREASEAGSAKPLRTELAPAGITDGLLRL